VDCVAAALQVVRRRTCDLEADTCLDLLIVDLGLPDGNGLTVIQETAHLHPQCAVMVVTVFGDEEHVVKAIEAGASGYLLKDSGPEQLLGALDDLLGGGSPVNPMVARLLLNRMRGAPAQDMPEAPASILSERETEILTFVAKGFSFADICRRGL
jgi:DNA-binding NarL/FixJ family response regulator